MVEAVLKLERVREPERLSERGEQIAADGDRGLEVPWGRHDGVPSTGSVRHDALAWVEPVFSPRSNKRFRFSS